MTRKKVVTKLLDFDHDDDIIVFPQNRTLYVDQFTDERPLEDEERETFMPRSIRDVFDYYRPQKDIQLETTEGKIVNEYFCFYSIDDFEDDQLIKQSELLSQQKIDNQAQEAFRKNLYHIHEQVKDLEVAYRTIDSFFANAEQGDMEHLFLMNVNKENLKHKDSADTLAVKEELENHYDRLSLRTNYSLLVIPGYLRDADIIRNWANIAYENKVMMVTDFLDAPDYHILKGLLEQANLQGPEAYLANIIMTCNYLRSRKRSELADEKEDLFIPGSAALAGRLTDTETMSISEAAAGRNGILSNATGVHIDLRKAEIASLIGLGVIPMVEIDGCTMAFSSCSLYSGSLSFLQEYPTIRVLDWICKVLHHIINEHFYELWSDSLRNDLIEAIVNCLDDYKGVTQPIDYYTIENLDKDPITKDTCLVVNLRLHNCIRPFILELTAHEDNFEGPVYEEVIHL